MDKKIILLCILLILFSSFSFSSSITNFNIPSEVKLNQEITATGISLDDSNVPSVNQLCSFYLLNADTGSLIDRASDQYTTQTGRFTMTPYTINEPNFKRDSNYTLKVECGSSSEDLNFAITQRETIGELGSQEFDYLTTPENVDTAFIWVIMGLLIIAFLGMGAFLIKYARGR